MSGIKLIPFSELPTRKEHSVPAAYSLDHPGTGMSYVGSTQDLYTRINQHKTRLAAGTHRNANLQEAYNSDPVFNLRVVFAESVKDARKIEQILLDDGHEKGRLFNIGKDAEKSTLGIPKSDEVREKLREANRIQFSKDVAREAHSAISKKVWENEEYRAKQASVVITEERKERISQATKQAWADPDIRDKYLTARRTPEARDRAATYHAKPVTLDGVTYPSYMEAGRRLGVSDSAIHKRLKRMKLKQEKENNLC